MPTIFIFELNENQAGGLANDFPYGQSWPMARL
jgi:hypothetical protein